MKINKLRLLKIRSYEDFELKIESGITVFTGLNGSGKTNLIEAVYAASTGKSYRTFRDEDMIRNSCEEGTIFLDFTRNNALHSIRLRLSRKEEKITVLNETSIRKKDLIGIFQTVLFSPDELQLIKGNPKLRRQFLNMEISQINPRYYEEILKYKRAVMQRNAAFKNSLYTGNPPEVDEWEMQIACSASYIVQKRIEAVERISSISNEMQHMLTNGKENLSISYIQSGKDSIHIETEWFMEKLASLRSDDARLCHTSIGPHRDDIVFLSNGNDLSHFGSQGQQRTAILSVKLSELECMEKETGEYPVLLLDDVCSELDKERQNELFSFLNGRVQTLITAESPDFGMTKNRMNIIILENKANMTQEKK